MAQTLTTRLYSVGPEALIGRLDATVIDLRSPLEYAEDHVSGAHSVSLFDDEERALVGTLYRRCGREPAFEAGVRITHGKIASLVSAVTTHAGLETPAPDELEERVRELTEGGMHALETRLGAKSHERLPDGAVVLCCWRGGLRSQSMAALMHGLGYEQAVFVEGGYKAWRGVVRRELEAWSPPPSVTLRGLTGVGKTLVLRELERLRPGWTLDLEGLAGHRSSILGMVGLEPVSQKTFERRLYERLQCGFPGHLVVEGESRKVGDVILPEAAWRAVSDGAGIELVASVERRVSVLIEDYLAEDENREHLARQLPFIEQRLGSNRYDGVLTGLLEAGREAELVELLLERYYDPLYQHSEKGRRYVARIDSSDPDVAAVEIAAWVEAWRGSRS